MVAFFQQGTFSARAFPFEFPLVFGPGNLSASVLAELREL